MRIDLSTLSEERLVILLQNTGDGEAFAFLVRPHERALKAFLSRLTRNGTHAEDICQEAMLKAYIQISKFQARSSFKTWLFSIAYNEFLQSQRKVVSFSRLVSAFERVVYDSHEADIGGSIDVQKALNKLPHNERVAILLSEAYGLTHVEVATIMSSPLGTVKTYIKRAKTSLSTDFS